MSNKHRVVVGVERECSKCHFPIAAGSVAVKDRSKRRHQKGKVEYYHTTHGGNE